MSKKMLLVKYVQTIYQAKVGISTFHIVLNNITIKRQRSTSTATKKRHLQRRYGMYSTLTCQ